MTQPMAYPMAHPKFAYFTSYEGKNNGVSVGKRRLKDQFNEHRRTIDNPNNKSKPTTAAEHFLSSTKHTANDMLLIPIKKIFSNRDSRPGKLF